ncbi:ferredoxin reductase [Patulibacter sp. NPDC049589]|uniref:ferredoxin reductase n=1 Tax=Patulibacter sp. NPDC049589 TaxID=3154731 RepID=UPI00342751EE
MTASALPLILDRSAPGGSGSSASGSGAASPRRSGARRGGLAQRLLGTKVADALAGPHDVDHYLELLQPTWAVRRIRGEIVAVRHQNTDSVTLTLRPTGTWPGFRAGQHVEISVDVDGVRHRRSYSPSASAHPRTKEIELTVRRHPEGVVSRYLKEHATPGMFVGLSVPRGEDFVLPDPRPSRIVLISGGSGITPVLSMLRTLTDEGHDGPIAFLHYARSAADVLYAGDLERIAAAHPNVAVHVVTTRDAGPSATDAPFTDPADAPLAGSPDAPTPGPAAGARARLTGRFGREHLARVLPADADAAAFVCGPGALVEAVRSLWADEGLATPLRFEHFAPPVLPDLDPGQLGTVTFAGSGIAAEADGSTLLEQAEAAGLSPVNGCRMGICLTCKCTLNSGVVRDTLSGEIGGTPGEEIRICVSAPVGDVSVAL